MTEIKFNDDNNSTKNVFEKVNNFIDNIKECLINNTICIVTKEEIDSIITCNISYGPRYNLSDIVKILEYENIHMKYNGKEYIMEKRKYYKNE